MLLQEVTIKNYRNFKDIKIPFDKFSALVGPNNIGKSSILQALEYIFAPTNVRNVQLSKADFLDTGQPICIEVAFQDLDLDDQAIFYHEDGLINPLKNTLRIRFISTWSSVEQDVVNECYFVRDDLPETQQRGPDFFANYKKAVPFFLISTDRLAAQEIGLTRNRDLGKILRIYTSDYLKPVSTLRAEIGKSCRYIVDTCNNWVDFPLTDFNRLHGLINKILSVIGPDFVATMNKDKVEDQEDDLEELNDEWLPISEPISQFLMLNPDKPYKKSLESILEQTPVLIKRARLQLSLFGLRSGLIEERQFEELSLGFKEVFDEMMPDQKLGVSLFSIADDELISQVSVDFDEKSILANGSGYQSMFVIGLKLVRALAQLRYSEEQVIRNFILGVEEPENHLHPHMQRHFVSFLKKIQTLWKNEGYQLQIVITTHSPSIVSRIEPYELILLSKSDQKIKANKWNNTQLQLIATQHESDPQKHGKAYKQLQLFCEFFMERYADVFFSNLVIVLEGETEEGAIPFWSKKLAIPLDCDRSGICFLNAKGSKLPFVPRILHAFGIDFYILFDSGDDHKTKLTWIDSKYLFPSQNNEFEDDLLSSASLESIIKSLEQAELQTSFSNRLRTISTGIPSCKNITNADDLIDLIHTKKIPNTELTSLRKQISAALQSNKGLLFGRCLAKNIGESEIPPYIKTMLEESRKLTSSKMEKIYGAI